MQRTEYLQRGFAAQLPEERDGRQAVLAHRMPQGQQLFLSGKSTLLNALLGEEVLPASVVPLTALPTFIRPGTILFI